MVTISRAHRPKRSERMKKADRLPGQLCWKTRMLGSVEEVACLQVQACHVALVAAKGDAAAAQQFAAEFDVLDGRVVQACMPLEQLQVAVGTVGIHVVVTKCIARAHPGPGPRPGRGPGAGGCHPPRGSWRPQGRRRRYRHPSGCIAPSGWWCR